MPEKPRIALIGLGLIGGSLGLAFKKYNLAARICGFARRAKTRETALARGCVDAIATSAQAAVRDADIVFLNVPPASISDIAIEIMPALKPSAILTDVGSVKASIIDAIAPALRDDIALVPAHPIAGTEQSGAEAGFAELFEGRWCILTPSQDTPIAAVDKIAALWRAVGSEVEFMDAAHHDLVLAVTSHLPHLIAFNIVGTAADLEADTRREVIKYSASGFRDFTRIAASDPIMWRDIFLHNRKAVLDILARFNEDLAALQKAVARGDGVALKAAFSRTRAIRRNIIAAGQEVDLPDFGRRRAPPAEPD